MKKTKLLLLRWCLLLIVMLCCFSPTRGETFKHNGIWYSTNDTQTVNVVQPSSGDVYKGDIEIPAAFTYNGRDYSVVGISASAFAEAKDGPHLIKSVRMGNNIKAIEEWAFSNCSEMTGVEISDRTLYLGTGAFWGSSELTNVKLGSELEEIRNRAFGNCVKLGRIDLPSSLKSIGDGAFGGCLTLSSIIIPDKVVSIGQEAFFNDYYLSSIKIGNSVSSIGMKCFSGCHSLKSFQFPQLVNEIAAETFYECASLTEIKFNGKIQKILDKAFYGCSSFTNFIIPASVVEIGIDAFAECTQIRSLTFEDSREPIRYDAQNFTQSPIESLTLGRTLKYSSDNTGAFSEKEKATATLKNVIVTKNVESLPKDIFKGCKVLANVEIEEGLKEIGESAFESCEGLKNLVLPNSISRIRSDAFAKCYYLGSINIPPQVTVIETQAFYQCRHMTEADLSNITEVKNGAFSECDRLETVTFSSKLNYIQNDAFNTCIALRTITIPENVKSLGSGAFYKAALDNITTLASVPPTAKSDTWDNGTYDRAILNIPSKSSTKYQEAEGWKNFSNIKYKVIYSVDVQANEGGEIILNGVSTNHIDIEEDASLNIEVKPQSRKIIESASYTMGSSTQSFSDKIRIAAVTADVKVNVRFADKPLVPPTSISFPQSEYKIKPGEPLALEVIYEPIDAYSPVTYSVVNGSNIVSIDNDILTGVANGVATIKATTQNGISATCVVIIDDGTFGIEDFNVMSLDLFQPYQLKLRGAGDIDVSSVKWESSNETIVKIFPNGVMMVVGDPFELYGGDFVLTISATLPDGRTAEEELHFYSSIDANYEFDYQGDTYIAIAPFEVSYYHCDYDLEKDIIVPKKVISESYEYAVTKVEIITYSGDKTVSLVLPSSITEVNIDTNFVNKIVCNAVNPPKGVVSLYYDQENVILVPAMSVSVYQSAEPWKKYIIKPIGTDFYNVNVEIDGPGHVLLNGEERTFMIIENGSSLTIEPESDYSEISFLEGSYTMSGKEYKFTEKVVIPSVDGDVNVKVVFGEPAPTSISFPTQFVNIEVGESQTLDVEYYPYGAYSPVVYSVITGEDCVKIEGDVITALKVGKATIQAETQNGLKAWAYYDVYDYDNPIDPTFATVVFDFTKPSSLTPAQTVNANNSPVCEVDGTTFVNGGMSLVSKGGGTSPRLWFYRESVELRVYNGATISISAISNGKQIKSIIFEGSQLDALSINGVTFADNSSVKYDLPMLSKNVEIKCATNGSHKRADIYTITVEYTETSGLEGINVEENDSIAIYNLQGHQIDCTLDKLSPGIYIIRQGNSVKKIAVK